MSLASLALIAFQVYWIGYTARSNNEVFGANVREAMQQVVRKLEKQELVYLTHIKTAEDNRRRQLMAISTKQAIQKQQIAKTTQKTLRKKHNSQSDEYLTAVAPSDMLQLNGISLLPRNLPINEISIQFDVENPSAEETEAIFRFNEFVGRQMQQMQSMYVDSNDVFDRNKTDEIRQIRQKNTHKARQRAKATAKRGTLPSQPAPMDKIAQKSAIMKDVFSDYLLKERPITERINRIALDSMLHTEMRARGIDIPLQYGIALKSDAQKLHYLSNPNMGLVLQNTLKTQGFKASLFPNDMFSSDNQLHVYFPDRKSFIMQSVWLNVLGSIAMIAIVLGCFYVAVNTILRQKKLADIKNDFINNMTHEFKTPISTIQLACEALADKDMQQNQSIMGRYLGIIKDENQRLGTQVEKVLQTALLDRGNTKMQLDQLNVHQLVAKTIENIAPQIELRNGSISQQLDANHDLVQADNLHLSNVIFNLIDNALKYSPQNPNIHISTYNTPTELAIQIADKGLGIAPEHQKTIFEKFFRVPTGNLHDVKGFGLGLSYVKKIVEEHQGRIQLQSKLGQGSTFSVYLPTIQPIATT
jgi:two-component system, OmpR family, phosphate regulon sensor histidine kinase PhoR